MLSMSRILFPVDYSDRCVGMLPLVKAVAAKCDAELILLYVATPLYMPAAGFHTPVPISIETIAEERDKLEKLGADQLHDIRVRHVVCEGDPAEEIVGFAKSEEIDLIAMPTHGRGAFRRFLIASVTAKVLHDVSCPVLTGVHLDEESAAQPATFSNVLCAIDLGPQSPAVLKCASQLAADFHARLGVAHAVPQPSPGSELLFTRDWRTEVANVTRIGVERLLSASGAVGRVYIEVGDPAKAVCSLAKEVGADLLVIGRGSRDEAGGRLTTHAYAIVRQSPCPVVSI